MAKQIDFENLTADDKQYFDDRPWLKEDYERQSGKSFDDLDFNLQDDDEDAQDDSSEPTGDSGDSNDPDSSKGESPDGDAGNGNGDGDEPVAPYSEWDYQVLKEEVAERELEVADQKKDTLVAALEADDASDEGSNE